MARRSVPPPKPKSPILTVGQKRRRIDRLRKCVTSLEAFDPHKARKRAPAVLELEAAIDKALASAFGYGTPAYLRYNQAATLDLDPLITKATRSPVLRPVGGPQRDEVKANEVRRNFSENKERSITLLRNAISALEEEIADAEPLVVAAMQSTATPVMEAAQESKVTSKAGEVRLLQPRRWGGIAFEAAWRRLARCEVVIHEPARTLSHPRVFSRLRLERISTERRTKRAEKNSWANDRLIRRTAPCSKGNKPQWIALISHSHEGRAARDGSTLP
jgi:hypothetical protein